MNLFQRIKHKIYSKAARLIRHLVDYDKSYQSFLYNGKYIEGKVDTVRMYYSLGLSPKMKGKSWLDLGCNEGSICLMASLDGASYVTGVELQAEYLSKARQHATKAGVDISFNEGNIVDFIPTAKNHDIVSLFALARHVYRYLMRKHGHEIIETGRAGMVYDSFEKMIQGSNSPVKEQFDGFLKTCIAKANDYFVLSINDHSGLILRNTNETISYFKSLSPRVEDIEVFNFSPQNPEYVVVKMQLSPR